MKHPSTLWINIFLKTQVGRENKSQFTNDTLGRWKKANPGGVYDAMIVELELAKAELESGKTGADTNTQQASTLRLDDENKKFIKTGQALHSFVGTTWEDDRAMMLEFFPSGKTEISSANRGDVLKIINRWIDRAAFHNASMGALWPGRLATLKTNWEKAISDQSGEKGTVGEGRIMVTDGWTGVAEVCMKMLWKLVDTHPTNPAIADVYFDITPLNIRKNTDNDDLGNAEFVTRNISEIPEPNVTITILTLNNEVVRTGTTDSTGRLKMKNLPVGQYMIKAEKPQFVANLPAFIEVLDDEDITIFITMNLG